MPGNLRRRGRARARRPFFRCLLLVLLLSLFVSFTGCRKKQLTPAELRAITREFVFAAKNMTSGKAEVGMRPEGLPATRSDRGQSQPAADHLYITLAPAQSGQTDSATLSRLENEFDLVAQQHHLLRKDLPGTPGLVRFDYQLGDTVTHAIHIVTPVVSLRPETPTVSARGSSPRLAIIIDDLGYDRASADALFGLHFPLTVSVLPNHPHSSDVAEEAHRRGYQVMLHLPMESSNGGARPEAIELRPGMKPEQASRLLSVMLDTVPYAVGVNNHQGSLATADPQLMAAIMPVLRERDLFFIDSRTTTATVAYDAAVRAGVPAASRKVFLDDVQTPQAVKQQLATAERNARRDGFAIAIGHPYPATLQALQQDLPQLKAHGVSLVFASQVVR